MKFSNVMVMKVKNVEKFLHDIRGVFQKLGSMVDTVSRLVPVTAAERLMGSEKMTCFHWELGGKDLHKKTPLG